MKPRWSLVAAALATSVSADVQTFTITSAPDYVNQRSCGKGCMFEDYNWVGNALGCGSPLENACLCREALGPAISSFATTCIEQHCTVGSHDDDLSMFLSIYNAYCLKNGYTLDKPVATSVPAATTIGDPSSPTVTRVTIATKTAATSGSTSVSQSSNTFVTTTTTKKPQVTVDITSKVTATPTSTPEPGGLSRSDQIALGVGIGIGLPATLGTLIGCFLKMLKSR